MSLNRVSNITLPSKIKIPTGDLKFNYGLRRQLYTLISSLVANVIAAKTPVYLENFGKQTTSQLIAVR